MAVIRRTEARQPLSSGSVVSYPSGSPVGPAISSAGDKLQNAAERFKQKRDELDEFKASRQYAAFKSGRMADLDKLEAEAEPGAPDLMVNAAESWNTAGREFVSSIPAHLQERYGVQLESDRAQFEYVAAGRERDSRYGFYRTELDKALPELQKVLSQVDPDDTGSIDAFRQQGAAVINATGLPSNEKKELLEKWRVAAPDAVAMSLLQKDPAALKAALGIDAPTIADAGEPSANEETAFRFFLGKGYTPQQAAGIVGNLIQESGVRPRGKPGDQGTAFGIAQWREDRFERLKRFAAQRGTDWGDLGTQLEFIDYELGTTERSAGERLRGATTAKEAAEAFIGFERPQGWTTETPRSGHGWKSRANNAVRALAQHGGKEPLLVDEGGGDRADPRFQDIPLERRFQLYNIAKAREDEVNAVERVTVAGLVADDVSSMTTTGTGVGGLDAQRVTDALGEQRALQWADNRIAAQSRFQAMDGMPSLTDEELSGRLDTVRPEPGSTGFDAAIATYDAAEAEVKRVRKERAEDPAESVKTLPEIRRAAEAWDVSTPEARRTSWVNMMRARLSAQERIGIAPSLQLPLTKGEAKQFAAPIRAAAAITLDGQTGDWFGMVDQLAAAFKESFGEYQDEAFRQVMMQLVGQDEEKAAYASNVIRRMLDDQAPPLADVRAFDETTETARTESVAKQFSGATDPAYTTTMAGRRPASSRLTPGGAPKPTAQSALPQVSEAERRALSKPTLNMPEPDDSDLQYLKDNPDTVEDFISIFGEQAVPEELR